jgi:hypothetical protein
MYGSNFLKLKIPQIHTFIKSQNLRPELAATSILQTAIRVSGGQIRNALQEKLLAIKFLLIKERVHPLSIRTLRGKGDRVGTERERTSWCN